MPPALNFSLSENFNFLVVGNPKYKMWALKSPIVEEFGDKIRISSTNDDLCRKFAAVCRKIIVTFCPIYFFRRF